MSKITITKPFRRWLFGGLGFHNSEATMTPIMSEAFYNQRVLKTFREISPTFSRVYGGFADWTQEAMDRFADYYDQTFRNAGTLIYMVPGRMPMPTEDFDFEDYYERTAQKLHYLIKVRGCTKIRYFCVTNELSVGNRYGFLSKNLDQFAKLHEGLYRAFQRHGLDVGLLATDSSGEAFFPHIQWAIENMDNITDDYCIHLYLHKLQPGDPELYNYCLGHFSELTNQARKVQRRFILGEYGLNPANRSSEGAPMYKDMSYAAAHPENDGIHAIAISEMALSVINSGTFAGVFWTLFDYPDPFIREDGDTPEEKARYDVARFSGHGLHIRYNKHGLIRWCDDEQDYSSRAALYTMGYLAKFFRKGSRVLDSQWDDDKLRAAAVTNGDGSVSVCIISWHEQPQEVELSLEHKTDKLMRRYDYSADNIPYNPFCDLQPASGTVACNGSVKLTLAPRSVTFLTTDYVDRIPSKIKKVTLKGNTLSWEACPDPEHCYYRVFADGTQIASTVALNLQVFDPKAKYRVISVDKYGNVGNET